ncbi:hypothetical protein HMPREF0401_02211 [Fusobacterium animalis 11_3_2]|jgi:hypothetical protein|uniref:Uncharacterized protein n=1 Tax=Fusobacterium animalis 11_3_2 TaxID=457403 RepID=F7L2Y8_9FUSO|nr:MULTISPECIES: hypothetical protein [Fusobacterium]EGN65415.1 hypothetical protein HMPREF0401_02211 [Fusobacterium animalis 11_3_2]
MIVLNLELDNLFGFEDFKINFLKRKEIITVTQYIRDIEKTMRFSMDFILDGKNVLYRVNF